MTRTIDEKIKDFTNQFSLTKTIRMELVPENENAKNLSKDYKNSKKNSLYKAKTLSSNYIVVKQILDDFYRTEINSILSTIDLTENNEISKAFDLFIESKNKKNEDFDKILKNYEKKLQKN